MKRLLVIATLVAVPFASVSAIALPSPVAPAAIAGLGSVTPPNCGQGAQKMPISSVSDGGNVWVTARLASIGLDCRAIVYGLTMVFAGQWNPWTGGCIGSITNPGTTMCLGPVGARLIPVTTTLSICFPTNPAQCWPGAAVVSRV